MIRRPSEAYRVFGPNLVPPSALRNAYSIGIGLSIASVLLALLGLGLVDLGRFMDVPALTEVGAVVAVLFFVIGVSSVAIALVSLSAAALKGAAKKIGGA